MSVLVIEDNTAQREAIAYLLNTENCDCVVAATINEGKRCAAQLTPTAVYLDWFFPEGCGLEFLQWLRNRPEGQSVPVLLLTGLSDTTEIQRSVQHLGPVTVVDKLLMDPTKLVHLLKSMGDKA